MTDIISHVTRVLAGRGNHPRLSLGMITEANARLVREGTGRDIAGYTRVLESSDIRHTIASHGNALRERARQQVRVTKHDFSLIPWIADHADAVRLIGEPKSANPQRLEYYATIAGVRYVYVEQIRPRGSIVALKTMRKIGEG